MWFTRHCNLQCTSQAVTSTEVKNNEFTAAFVHQSLRVRQSQAVKLGKIVGGRVRPHPYCQRHDHEHKTEGRGGEVHHMDSRGEREEAEELTLCISRLKAFKALRHQCRHQAVYGNKWVPNAKCNCKCGSVCISVSTWGCFLFLNIGAQLWVCLTLVFGLAKGSHTQAVIQQHPLSILESLWCACSLWLITHSFPLLSIFTHWAYHQRSAVIKPMSSGS